MKILKHKYILPLLVLAGFYLLAQIVKSNPPSNKRGRPSQTPQLNVDVKTLTRENFPVVVESYGTVKPRTQSVLLPQVSGQIIAVSKKFREGGFFEKGDILVELDDRDLKAEVKIAQANLLSAEQTLSEEKARVEQAKQDWARLGNSDIVPELVSRKPQLMAAEAKLFSAQASVDKAKLSVERTKIVAPYTGRILSKEVDLGQVISPNTRLAEIYAVDYVEIRLPVKNKDLAYMVLPESTRYKTETVNQQPLVTFQSNISKGKSWYGKVMRTEGAYDQSSQQLFVVAQIDDPYGTVDQTMPIKIGQYVSAKINGRVIENALTVPNKAIYQGSYVYIVEDGLLKRQEIDIAWQNHQVAIIEQGVSEGQLLVLTPLGQVNSGTRVSINEQDGKMIAKKPNRNAEGIKALGKGNKREKIKLKQEKQDKQRGDQS